MKDYFYGWYFRCQTEKGTVALIPAFHIRHGKPGCSVQIITEEKSWVKEFSPEMFRINRDRSRMQIGRNLFSLKGIQLDMEAAGEKLSGSLRFGKITPPEYDIMGPFCAVPGMKCRHAVYSLDHSVNGRLFLGERELCFQDGRGYTEGDRGSSFPDRYFWTQLFFPEGTLMLAAASISPLGLRLKGITGILLYRGREHRFATYLGAHIVEMNEKRLVLRQRGTVLEVSVPGRSGCALLALEKGKMSRIITENVSCPVECTFHVPGKKYLRIRDARGAWEYDKKTDVPSPV